MKKFVLALFFALFLAPVAILAQGDVPVPPESWTLTAIFASVATVAFVNTHIVQFFKKWILKSHPVILSAITALILSTAGWLLKLGIFIDHGWWWILVYGVATTFVSNGFKDWYKYLMMIIGLIPKEKR